MLNDKFKGNSNNKKDNFVNDFKILKVGSFHWQSKINEAMQMQIRILTCVLIQMLSMREYAGKRVDSEWEKNVCLSKRISITYQFTWNYIIRVIHLD